MGWLMLILALEIQDFTFGFAGINFLWTTLNGFPRDVTLLFGPSVYFYLLAQTKPDFKLQKKDWLHLLPFAYSFIPPLIIFLQGPYAVQSWDDSPITEAFHVSTLILRWLSYVFYFYQSIRLYSGYRKWLVQVYSDPDSMDLRWFRNFLIILIIGILFMEFMFLLDSFLDLDFYEVWWWNLWLVLIIILTGIRAYAQPQLVNLDGTIQMRPEASSNEKEDSNEELSLQFQKIEEHISKEKLFLQPGLTLRLLAESVRLQPGEVSQAINSVKQMNFNDFVNSFRVEEFKKRALDPENDKITLLGLAFDSGFNSKATFNRVFQKFVGQSPGEWLSREKKKLDETA